MATWNLNFRAKNDAVVILIVDFSVRKVTVRAAKSKKTIGKNFSYILKMGQKKASNLWIKSHLWKNYS